MNGFKYTSIFCQTVPWTCRSCTRQAQRQIPKPGKNLRNYTAVKRLPRLRKRRNVALAVAGSTAVVGAFTFTDDIKHAYKAVERTGRVVGTLAVCINEWVPKPEQKFGIFANASCSYRVTLNQNEKTTDEKERTRCLRACHQRCANRTLEVLEKNGSVFIKLGQHLVSP